MPADSFTVRAWRSDWLERKTDDKPISPGDHCLALHQSYPRDVLTPCNIETPTAELHMNHLSLSPIIHIVPVTKIAYVVVTAVAVTAFFSHRIH